MERGTRILDHITRVLLALTINLSVIFAMWVWMNAYFFSREHLFYTYLLFSLGIVAWRIVFIYSIRYYRARGFNSQKVVIIGAEGVSNYLANYFNENSGLGFDILGYFDDQISGKEIKGKVHDFYKFASDNDVDIVFCNLLTIPEDEIERILNFSQNHLIQVKLVSKFSFLGDQSLKIQHYGHIPVVDVASVPLDNIFNRTMKRAFDIAFSLLVVVGILSWLLPILAILIKLESPGPVFFRQIRTGKKNLPFGCLKLRSMHVNTDSDKIQASRGDSRITKVGAVLRKTSLDELPQFINVLIGDMSVVGPRPHMLAHTEEYSKKVDKFMARHFVKPGITGLAQAKGFRGETRELKQMEWRVKLDRFYVYNWSMWLDIKIISLTIFSSILKTEDVY